ncbi:MAG TPA: hypothetical protein VFC39_09455 [Acidobacteriaceae bacterium]|nr:hypothetical protein [Acidobacteriaceae bacterium]
MTTMRTMASMPMRMWRKWSVLSNPQAGLWGSVAQLVSWARSAAAAYWRRVCSALTSAGLTCEVGASMMEERLMSRQF